jgi:ATP-dependent RNA helicase RhlE
MSVRTVAIFGGVNINTQKTTIYKGCDILVGTPGNHGFDIRQCDSF